LRGSFAQELLPAQNQNILLKNVCIGEMIHEERMIDSFLLNLGHHGGHPMIAPIPPAR